MSHAQKIARNVNIYVLQDLPKEKVQQAIMALPGVSEEDFEDMYQIIGGRPGHIHLIMDSVKNNCSHSIKNVSKEARIMLYETKQHVMTNGIGHEYQSPNGKWTQIQFWRVIKILVERVEGVSYDELVAECGNDIPLHAMKKFIARKDENSIRHVFTYPSPLHYYAYRELLQDNELIIKMENLEHIQKVKEMEQHLINAEKEIYLKDRIRQVNPQLIEMNKTPISFIWDEI